jgi:hypothetical protein
MRPDLRSLGAPKMNALPVEERATMKMPDEVEHVELCVSLESDEVE